MTIPEYAFQTTYTLCRSSSHTNSTTSLAFLLYYCSKHVCSGLVYSAYNTTTTLHQFNGLFSETACVSQYQKGKPVWIKMRQEMMGFWDGSGISWTICKQSAPRSRQITTPNTSSLNFYRPDVPPYQAMVS